MWDFDPLIFKENSASNLTVEELNKRLNSKLFSVKRDGKIFTAKTKMLPKPCHATLMRFNNALVRKVELFSKTRINFPSLRDKTSEVEVIGRRNDVTMVLELFYDICSHAAGRISKGVPVSDAVPDSDVESMVDQFIVTVSTTGRCTCTNHDDKHHHHNDNDDDDDDLSDTEGKDDGHFHHEDSEDDSYDSDYDYSDDNSYHDDDDDDSDHEFATDHSCSSNDERVNSRVNKPAPRFNEFFGIHLTSREKNAAEKALKSYGIPFSAVEAMDEVFKKKYFKSAGKSRVEAGKSEVTTSKSSSGKVSKAVSEKTDFEKNLRGMFLKSDTKKSVKKDSKSVNVDLQNVTGVEVLESSDGKKKKRKRRRTDTTSSCLSDQLSLKNSKISVVKERNRTSSDPSRDNSQQNSDLSKASSRRKNRVTSSASVKSNSNPDIAKESGNNLKNNTFLQFLAETDKPENKLNTYQHYLKFGSEALIAKDFSKAITNLKTARDTAKDLPQASYGSAMDSVVFTYTLCSAYINSGSYDNIVLAINELNSVPSNMVSRLPAIKYLIAYACHKLNRFKIAGEILEKMYSILEKHVIILESFFYPRTKIVIPETELETLKSKSKKLESDCRLTQHSAVAVCRFDKCLELSSHIYPSKYIYSNDPDFCGYIVVVCQEKCDVEYHINCWKAYKESKVALPGKVTDKDFLSQPCPTMDCVLSDGSLSSIIKIDIYDSQGSIKHSTAVDVMKLKLEAAKRKEKDKEKQEKNEKSKPIEKVSSKKKLTPRDANLSEDVNKTKTKLTPKKPVEKKPPPVEKVKLHKLPFSLNSDQVEKNKTDNEEKLVGCLDRIDALRLIWQSQGYIDPSTGQINDCEDFPANLQHLAAENADIKTFIWSMFKEMLLAEGFQKVTDIEQKWACNEEFRDVKMMLKDPKNICDILLESNDFYIIEDTIALQAQLPDLYSEVKTVTLESLRFFQSLLFKSKKELPQRVETSSDLFRFLPPVNEQCATSVRPSTDDPFRFLPPLDDLSSSNHKFKWTAPHFAEKTQKATTTTCSSEDKEPELSEAHQIHTGKKSNAGSDEVISVTKLQNSKHIDSLIDKELQSPKVSDFNQNAPKKEPTIPVSQTKPVTERITSALSELHSKLPVDTSSFNEPFMKNSLLSKTEESFDSEESTLPKTNHVENVNSSKETSPKEASLLHESMSSLIKSVSQIYQKANTNLSDSTNTPSKYLNVKSSFDGTQEPKPVSPKPSSALAEDSLSSESVPSLPSYEINKPNSVPEIVASPKVDGENKLVPENDLGLKNNKIGNDKELPASKESLFKESVIKFFSSIIVKKLSDDNLCPKVVSPENISSNIENEEKEASAAEGSSVISPLVQSARKISLGHSIESIDGISSGIKSDQTKADKIEEFFDCNLSEKYSECNAEQDFSNYDLVGVCDDEHVVCEDYAVVEQTMDSDTSKNFTDQMTIEPNNKVLHLCNGISGSMILKEIEQILSYINEFNKTGEINIKILYNLVNSFLSKFGDAESKKIDTESDKKIVFKKKVKLCLDLSKKITQYFLNQCKETVPTIHSFGVKFIKQYGQLMENIDLDAFSCDNFDSPLQISSNSVISPHLESSVPKTDAAVNENAEKPKAGCQIETFRLDAGTITDCSLYSPGDSEEVQQLFYHIKSQNSAILEFFKVQYPFMSPIISEKYERMKTSNDSYERNTDDQVSLLSLNSLLFKTLTATFDKNVENFRSTMKNVLSNLKDNHVNVVFKLLRSQYTEKILDYEAFLKKFCTNSTRNLSCWIEVQNNVEQYRKTLHQLDYKEHVFKLKLQKLESKLAKNGIISEEDMKDLFELEFDEDPVFKLTVSTIGEVFVSLLKAAATEFQKQNQQVLLKVLLQAKNSNLISPDLTAQILMQQQQSLYQETLQSTPSFVSDHSSSLAGNKTYSSASCSDSVYPAAQDIGDVNVVENLTAAVEDIHDSDHVAPNEGDCKESCVSSEIASSVSCDDITENSQNVAFSITNACDHSIEGNEVQSQVNASGSKTDNYPGAIGYASTLQTEREDLALPKEKFINVKAEPVNIESFNTCALQMEEKSHASAEMKSTEAESEQESIEPPKVSSEIIKISNRVEKVTSVPKSQTVPRVSSENLKPPEPQPKRMNASVTPAEACLGTSIDYSKNISQSSVQNVTQFFESTSGEKSTKHSNDLKISKEIPAAQKPVSARQQKESPKLSVKADSNKNLSKNVVQKPIATEQPKEPRKPPAKSLDVQNPPMNVIPLNTPLVKANQFKSAESNTRSQAYHVNQTYFPEPLPLQETVPHSYYYNVPPLMQGIMPPGQYYKPYYHPSTAPVPWQQNTAVAEHYNNHFKPPAPVLKVEKDFNQPSTSKGRQKPPELQSSKPSPTSNENPKDLTNMIPLNKPLVPSTSQKSSQQKKTEDSAIKSQKPTTSAIKSKFLATLKNSCFKKLMLRLHEKYSNKTDIEVMLYLKTVRERNRDSLSGLSFNEIIVMVDSLVDTPSFKFSKHSRSSSTSVKPSHSVMGLEKFGQSAWVKNEVRDNSNYSNEDLKECVVCCSVMTRNTTTTLECKHVFHTHCIREWLKIKCVCPLCQTFCRMPDEYPSLR